MGWLLEARGRESVGRWLGSGLGLLLLTAGVLAGTVTAEAMLVAAWLENLSAGAATLRALLRAPGGRLVLSANVQVSGIPVRTEPDGTRSIPAGCAAGFFLGHFGLFTLVHGTFLAVAVFASAVGASGGDDGGDAGLSGTALLVVAIAAVLRALRRVEPGRAIVQAYAGLIPVHVGVLVLFTAAVDLDAAGTAGRGPALLVVGLLLVGDQVRNLVGRGAAPVMAARPAGSTDAAPPPHPPPSPPPRSAPPPPRPGG